MPNQNPPVDPCILVIFGASGDLTARKLVPALYDPPDAMVTGPLLVLAVPELSTMVPLVPPMDAPDATVTPPVPAFAVVPELSTMEPVELVPAPSAVVMVRPPDDDVPSPVAMVTLPPALVPAVVVPAEMDTSPPPPLLVEPTTRDTAPAAPPTASPDDTTTSPTVPAAVVPLVSSTDPELLAVPRDDWSVRVEASDAVSVAPPSPKMFTAFVASMS